MRKKTIMGTPFWCDENGNMWNAFVYTEHMAEKLSGTLVGCHYCIDCVNCSFCMSCVSCVNCHHLTEEKNRTGMNG